MARTPVVILLLPVLLAGVISTSRAAVTVLNERSITWSFSLSGGRSPGDSLDQFHFSFGTDKFEATDRLSVSVWAEGQPEPLISKTLSGSANGLGTFVFLRDLDNAFPQKRGMVLFEMLEGSVDLLRAGFLVKTPDAGWGATTNIGVRLVPEPSIACFAAGAGALTMARRKRHRRLE